MIIQLFSSQASKIDDYINAQTIVVLIQDGVYACKNILNQYPDCEIYALDRDWHAAGLETNIACQLLSDQEWVLLCSKHSPIISLQD
ncbi:DsrH/TusB family sulfur metabolism protein [Glaciecola petra]|uniref:DsrH/TusB family sulfur metabolism protein n=1 Tax=Glaciecola petra TaxID=3075602 RepID=A0ABU2ZNS4_9ALTE|nr:DsrH/TusB family sulfur metabolism protein [Aestuariibacter sp. P117]MDT0594270.1 DsrH/TusB family sulfur metabolism protein [Aestuariibacter sp. P117]